MAEDLNIHKIKVLNQSEDNKLIFLIEPNNKVHVMYYLGQKICINLYYSSHYEFN